MFFFSFLKLCTKYLISNDAVVTETAVPSFPDGDLEFEDLNFEEKFEENKTDMSEENFLTKEDEALQQEATLSDVEKETDMAENVDEEQCGDESYEEDFEGVMSRDKTTEDNYTSSGSEQEVSGQDEEDEEEDMGPEGEKPGDLLRSVRCGVEFCDKEDRIFAEGEPPAPQGAENPQVRNEKQGESDEEVSYFERVPERGIEMMIRGDGIEEDEQEREEEKEEDSYEGMKIEQEENVLCFEQEVESPYRDDQTKAGLEFPEISAQNLQDLVAEVDSEEYGEKMKDFSGDEHQDAGESFAEYPSDFSSCEYVEERGKNQESLACASDRGSIAKERAVTDVTWMGRADEEGDGYLYSRDLEVDADTFKSWDVATGEEEIVENVSGETSESDSYTSSDDEFQEKRSDEELFDSTCLQDLESKQLEEPLCGSSAAFSDDYDRANPADFNIKWNLDVFTTDSLLSEDLLTTDEAETPLSDVTQRPAAEDVNSYSEVQREDPRTTTPSNQGSVDDSFFFNTEAEASGVTELGQLGDDEYEEDRNWEQEQERIKAFYEFYDDSDAEDGGEGE